MRYEIHAIANAECTEIHQAVIASTNDVGTAKTLAAENSRNVYGAAILDRETGLIDWGFGFGVEVPELDEN